MRTIRNGFIVLLSDGDCGRHLGASSTGASSTRKRCRQISIGRSIGSAIDLRKRSVMNRAALPTPAPWSAVRQAIAAFVSGSQLLFRLRSHQKAVCVLAARTGVRGFHPLCRPLLVGKWRSNEISHTAPALPLHDGGERIRVGASRRALGPGHSWTCSLHLVIGGRRHVAGSASRVVQPDLTQEKAPRQCGALRPPISIYWQSGGGRASRLSSTPLMAKSL